MPVIQKILPVVSSVGQDQGEVILPRPHSTLLLNAMLATIWLISRRSSGDRVTDNMLFSKMTNFEGMPSYFWLASSRLKEPIRDYVPYTSEALRQDLLRLLTAWKECQASRARNAIYGYLTAVFDLVLSRWTAEDRALDRAHWAQRLRSMCPFEREEPFAAIIRCTADQAKVDKKDPQQRVTGSTVRA